MKNKDVQLLELIDETAHRIAKIQTDDWLEDILSSIKFSAPELWNLRLDCLVDWLEETVELGSENETKINKVWEDFNTQSVLIIKK